jgi:hypothetical protein
LSKIKHMTTTNYTVKIENEMFGKLLHETFVDAIQFKLFLKMIQGCLELKNDLTFFNGCDFLIHIPFKYLVDSIIVTSTFDMTLADHMRSKVEALVTKETE